MRTMMRTGTLIAMVVAAAVAATAAQAAAPDVDGSDASVMGRGTWVFGAAHVGCSRDARPNSWLLFEDQCSYKASTAPEDDPESEDGCIEFAHETIVGGCRATLAGTTTTMSRIPDVCTQGGSLDGTPEYPVGTPDGKVMIYSAALDKTYSVPVSITVNGAVGRVFGVRHVDSGTVGEIVVEGEFLWNLQGEQSCPIQGTDPTSGVWQGHYTFFRDALAS